MRVIKMMAVLLLTAVVTALIMNRSIKAYTQVRYHFTLFESNIITELCAAPVDFMSALRRKVTELVSDTPENEDGFETDGPDAAQTPDAELNPSAVLRPQGLWPALLAGLRQMPFDTAQWIDPKVRALPPERYVMPHQHYMLVASRRSTPPSWYRQWRLDKLRGFAAVFSGLYALPELFRTPPVQTAGTAAGGPAAPGTAEPAVSVPSDRSADERTEAMTVTGPAVPGSESASAGAEDAPQSTAAVQPVPSGHTVPAPSGGSDKEHAAVVIPQHLIPDAQQNPPDSPGGQQPSQPVLPARPPLPAAVHGDHWRLKVKAGSEFLLVGDSLMQAMTWGLEHDLRQKGYKVVNIAKSSTGLTNRAFYNWSEVLAAQLKRSRPDFVVVMIGANDPWGIQDGKKVYPFKTPEWDEAYGGRVAELINMSRACGAEVIWYELPAMRSPGYNAKIEYMNGVYERTVKSLGGYWINTDTTFQTDHRQYVTHARDEKGKVRKVRTDDGIHFTGLGARLLGKELISRLDEEPAVTAAEQSAAAAGG